MNPRAVSILQLALNGRRRCPTHARLSNAKWQQQKAWLSPWCKSQQTSGNVELLRVVERRRRRVGEGLGGEARRFGGKERRRDGSGVGGLGDEDGKDEGWGRGAQGVDGEAARAEWRDECIEKNSGSPDRESVDDAVCQVSILSAECLCSPQAAQHGPASFCALIHSHTMSSCSLLSPPPPTQPPRWCTWLHSGFCHRDKKKKGLLCVCRFHAKFHLRFRIMQMVPNVCLRWSHSSLYYFCVNHNL